MSVVVGQSVTALLPLASGLLRQAVVEVAAVEGDCVTVCEGEVQWRISPKHILRSGAEEPVEKKKKK